MISIVHLITGLDTGGAESTLVGLLSRFDRRRFSNSVVSLTGEGTNGHRIRELGIPLTPLHMRSVPGPWTLWSAARAIRAARADIVQTWLYHADLVGALVAPAAGARNLCWNIRCAELDPAHHARSMRAALALLARLSPRPATIVVNAAAGRRAHERLGYRPKRWELIPNGFDTQKFSLSPERRERFRARLGVSRESPLVGLVARYHPMKDHATFIKAAAIVAGQRPDVHFVMAGLGVTRDNAALTETLEKAKLLASTHLCGEVEDVAELYAGLDIAVCSSYSEAFPNVIGEAMSCGVPCVATAVGDTADLVGTTGRIVPPRDGQALAAALLELLGFDRAARGALGRAARERIVSEYSLDRAVARYEQLYEDLAAARYHDEAA